MRMTIHIMRDLLLIKKFFCLSVVIFTLSITELYSGFIREYDSNGNIYYSSINENQKIIVKDNKIKVIDYSIQKLNNDKINLKQLSYGFEFINSNKFSYISKSSQNVYFNKFSAKTNFKSLIYDTLSIKNLYNDIDLVLYFENSNLRYDFLINSNANYSEIKQKFFDCEVSIENNRLIIQSERFRNLHQDLKAYSIKSYNTEPIDVSFSNESNSIIRYNLNIDDDIDVIRIDPVISSTFIGGKDYDYIKSMVRDNQGNIIVAGHTLSNNYPYTAGSLDTLFDENDWGFNDIFISKFDSTTKQLLFSTYLGGIGDDIAESIAISNKGNIFISGYTISLHNFPYTNGAIDSIDRGGYDVFVSKLSPEGDSLIYSTLIGGSGDDYAISIAVDSTEFAYITGYTNSFGSFPVSKTAYDTSGNGKYDCFISKVNQNGTALIYSTYLGGSNDDFSQSISVDTTGIAYIAGITRSVDYPVSFWAYNKNINDTSSINNPGDAFSAKISSSGSDLLYSTFIGGFGKDAAYGIVLSSDNNIYITGATDSKNFPTHSNAFDNELNHKSTGTAGDAFVLKLKNTGDSLIYSTFIGGRNNERGNFIHLDAFDNVYICGSTSSTDFPTTKAAFDRTYNDTLDYTDAFVCKINQDLSHLLYSSYSGGYTSDVGTAVSEFKGNIILAGWTGSNNFPSFSNVFDKSYNDTNKADGFVMVFKPNLIEVDAGEDISICSGDTVVMASSAYGGYGTLKLKWKPSAFISNDSIASPKVYPPVTTNYILTVTDSAANIWQDTVKIIVNQKPKPNINGAKLVFINSQQDYISYSPQVNKFYWTVENGVIQGSNELNKITVKWQNQNGIGRLKLVETSPELCADSVSFQVFIGQKYKPVINYSGKTEFCSGDSIILDAGANYKTYTWSDGKTSRLNIVSTSGDYWVFVTDSLGFGGISDTIKIIVHPTPNPLIEGINSVRINRPYSYIVEKHTGSKYEWIISGGLILSGQSSDSIVVRWNNTNGGSLRVVETNSAGCIGSSQIMNISISDYYKPKVRLLGSNPICQGDSILLDAGYGFTKYLWNDGRKSRFISVKNSGKYWANVQDDYGFSANTDTVDIYYLPLPAKPIVGISDNFFTCQGVYKKYQWYMNDTMISGANLNYYYAKEKGRYRVRVFDSVSCYNYSDYIYYKINDIFELNNTIKIYPNPGNDIVYISINENDFIGGIEYELINYLGEIILSDKMSDRLAILNVSGLSSGVYLLKMKIDGKWKNEKLIINR